MIRAHADLVAFVLVAMIGAALSGIAWERQDGVVGVVGLGMLIGAFAASWAELRAFARRVRRDERAVCREAACAAVVQLRSAGLLRATDDEIVRALDGGCA